MVRKQSRGEWMEISDTSLINNIKYEDCEKKPKTLIENTLHCA